MQNANTRDNQQVKSKPEV